VATVQLSSGLLIPPNTTLLGLGADSTQLEFTMVPPKPTEVRFFGRTQNQYARVCIKLL
jgi:hypothetical protein